MVTKTVLGLAIVNLLIYGYGSDFGSIKHNILNSAKSNGQTVMARDNGGWGR